MDEVFRKLAQRAAHVVGTSRTFLCALAVIVVWGATGPLFHYSDTWQLIINTGTTIVTFLMVFLIQNTQNRDAQALHLKLDELIRANAEARNYMVHLERLSDRELDRVQGEFDHLDERAQQANRQRPRGARATQPMFRQGCLPNRARKQAVGAARVSKRRGAP